MHEIRIKNKLSIESPDSGPRWDRGRKFNTIRTQHKGVDSCQGDSGGPLICIVNKSPVLYGIISWGVGCGREGLPGLYAKVASEINWIKQIVNGNAGQTNQLYIKPTVKPMYENWIPNKKNPLQGVFKINLPNWKVIIEIIPR